MKLGLIIFFDTYSSIILSLTLGETVISSKKYKGQIDNLSVNIPSFLLNNSVSASDIVKVIIICDLTNFKITRTDFDNKIACIQLIPKHEECLVETKVINSKKIRIHSLNVGLPESHNYKSNIKKAVSFLNKNNITKVAVNSYFSTIYPDNENEAIEIINSISTDKLNILPSHIYNTFNYLQRRNFQLLNIIYSSRAELLINKLKEILNTININSSIFFLTGNGSLVTEYTILSSPLLTWLSSYTGKIIGSSKITNNNNSIVVNDSGQGFTASGVRNLLPILTTEFSNHYSFRIPNYFPKIVHINDKNNSIKINEILNHFKIKEDDFLPVIILSSERNNYSLIANPIINIKSSPELTCIGASTANYKKEFYSFILNKDEDNINLEKEKLLKEAALFLKKNDIDLTNIDCKYDVIPLMYTKANSLYIKLSLIGEV